MNIVGKERIYSIIHASIHSSKRSQSLYNYVTSFLTVHTHSCPLISEVDFSLQQLDWLATVLRQCQTTQLSLRDPTSTLPHADTQETECSPLTRTLPCTRLMYRRGDTHLDLTTTTLQCRRDLNILTLN